MTCLVFVVLRCVILCCAMLGRTGLCFALLSCSEPSCALLYYFVLPCPVLYCVVLHCFLLSCVMLYRTVLRDYALCSVVLLYSAVRTELYIQCGSGCCSAEFYQSLRAAKSIFLVSNTLPKYLFLSSLRCNNVSETPAISKEVIKVPT